MHSFTFQENSIYYLIHPPKDGDDEELIGEHKSLVFLHGFLEDHSMWKNIIPPFQKLGYTCISIDLPCHGQSRFSGEICTMQYMAEGVNAILNELNFQPEKIIGHSMGGYVALELTRFRELEPILIHSNFWADSAQKKNDRNRVIEIVKKNKALFINEAIPGLFAPLNKSQHGDTISKLITKANTIPTSEICAATAGMRDRDAFYHLENLSRLSIIHGELDPIIQTEQMYEELEKIESSYLYDTMLQVGHMGIWEDQKTVISTIKNILFS